MLFVLPMFCFVLTRKLAAKALNGSRNVIIVLVLKQVNKQKQKQKQTNKNNSNKKQTLVSKQHGQPCVTAPF